MSQWKDVSCSKISQKDKYYYIGDTLMAKINESIIVVKVSELVADNAPETPPITDETLAQLEEIIRELAGAKALVEIEKG